MQDVDCELESSEQIAGSSGPDSAEAGIGTQEAADWRLMLAKVVSSEIVPRLMMMQNSCQSGGELAGRMVSPVGVPEFTRRLLASESAESQAFLEALERQGMEPEKILLNYFAPAARKLGELWTADRCDFIQVSIGLHRLQSFMDDICAHYDGPRDRSDAPRILLLPAPGETHEFGVAMVGNFFRADGWRVTASSPSSILQHIHARWFEVVGISLSCTRHLGKLVELLADARRLSRNRSVKIVLGGPVFSDNPTLALEVGSDGTAADAQGAVQLARSLLDASKSCESAQTEIV